MRSAHHEQFHRLGPADDPGVRRFPGIRQRQRWDGELLLAVHVQRRPTRHQHAHTGRGGQHSATKAAASGTCSKLSSTRSRSLSRRPAVPTSATGRPAPPPDPERVATALGASVGSRTGTGRRRRRRRRSPAAAPRRPQREPGLAGPSGPGQGDQPMARGPGHSAWRPGPPGRSKPVAAPAGFPVGRPGTAVGGNRGPARRWSAGTAARAAEALQPVVPRSCRCADRERVARPVPGLPPRSAPGRRARRHRSAPRGGRPAPRIGAVEHAFAGVQADPHADGDPARPVGWAASSRSASTAAPRLPAEMGRQRRTRRRRCRPPATVLPIAARTNRSWPSRTALYRSPRRSSNRGRTFDVGEQERDHARRELVHIYHRPMGGPPPTRTDTARRRVAPPHRWSPRRRTSRRPGSCHGLGPDDQRYGPASPAP